MGSHCGEGRGKQFLYENDVLCNFSGKLLLSFQDILLQVKNLSVAREMVKSMAIEAQAAREANGMLILQKGEGRSLEKIR